ncbi:Sec-independent protein translocase protein TatB [Hoeflea sp.]|uniref:Sec-independent protein translocase protein TatB n=1 Tax=Hoeflea sp. TaxID=1940281 RepID=UPI0037497C0D
MLDIGWPELLVVAIVLIVVVGPKDLPPMLRAFGRTTKKLRGMASEFRGQFDEALREAELDDVKKTFDEARKLNPMQGIRDAVNPLKDTAKDIKADLEKTVNSAETPSTPSKVEVPDPNWKLPDSPPKVEAPKAASGKAKPRAAKTTSAKSTKAKTVTKSTGKTPAAKAAPAKTAAAKPAAKAPPTKAPAQAKSAAAKPAASKAAAAKPAQTKSPTRARKTKQSEGSA